MTEKEKILLYSYVYNNTLMLENEVKQLQSNIRFRRIDTPDIFELLCAQMRLEMFKEISEHILTLTGLPVMETRPELRERERDSDQRTPTTFNRPLPPNSFSS